MRCSRIVGWLGLVTTLGLCSYFGARAATLFMATHTAGTEAGAATVRPLSPPEPTMQPLPSAARQSVVGRNIFCSDCASASTPAGGHCSNAAHTSLTRSTLPISLTATLRDATDGGRFAVIYDRALDRVGVLGVDSFVPGAGPVIAILATRMVFDHLGRREYIDLRARNLPASAIHPIATPPPGRRRGSELARRIADGIHRQGAGRWQLERRAVNLVFDNLHQLAGEARVVPIMREGKPAGFRLARVRDGGVYSLMGLRSGDLLEAVNGRSIQSMGQALGSLASLRHATRLRLSFRRAGRLTTHEYAVR